MRKRTNRRSSRLEIIRQILSQNQVRNQVHLLSLLADQGIHVTQATLSRDLRLLGMKKTVGPDGKIAYAPVPHREESAPGIVQQGLLAKPFAFSGNLAVVHTQPGYAGGVASCIDKAGIGGLLGTIAGDDTVLLILDEGTPHTHISRQIEDLFAQ